MTMMKCRALRVRGHHSAEGLEAAGVAEEGDEDVAEVVQEVWWKGFPYTSSYLLRQIYQDSVMTDCACE